MAEMRSRFDSDDRDTPTFDNLVAEQEAKASLNLVNRVAELTSKLSTLTQDALNAGIDPRDVRISANVRINVRLQA
jgi:hypothetical protein